MNCLMVVGSALILFGAALAVVDVLKSIQFSNITKYYMAKFCNVVFIENKTGAIYSTDGWFRASFLHRAIMKPSLSTESPEGLSPGIGMSTSIIEDYKEMSQFTYIGRI